MFCIYYSLLYSGAVLRDERIKTFRVIICACYVYINKGCLPNVTLAESLFRNLSNYKMAAFSERGRPFSLCMCVWPVHARMVTHIYHGWLLFFPPLYVRFCAVCETRICVVHLDSSHYYCQFLCCCAVRLLGMSNRRICERGSRQCGCGIRLFLGKNGKD